VEEAVSQNVQFDHSYTSLDFSILVERILTLLAVRAGVADIFLPNCVYHNEGSQKAT